MTARAHYKLVSVAMLAFAVGGVQAQAAPAPGGPATPPAAVAQPGPAAPPSAAAPVRTAPPSPAAEPVTGAPPPPSAEPASAAAPPPATPASSAPEPAPPAAPVSDGAVLAQTPEQAAVVSEPAIEPGDPWGDDLTGVQAGPVTLRLLVQARYRQTFAPASDDTRTGYAVREDTLVHDNDGYRLHRFFVRIGANPLPQLGFKAILDFAKLTSNAENVLKQAYVTVRPMPKHLEFAAGLLKLPFSTLELDPSAAYELADFGVADDLIKEMGFAGRDYGAQVMVAPLKKSKRLRFWFGAFRGNSKDENASPVGALGGRVESHLSKHFRIGADVVGMPQSVTYRNVFETSKKKALPMPPDPLYPNQRSYAAGKAFSVDATFTRKHWGVRGEGILGDRVDVDTRYGAKTFMAAWALASYRFDLGFMGLQPAARIAWIDSDREHDVGARRELGLGVNLLFNEHLRLLLDVTNTDVEPGTPVLDAPLPIPTFPYADLDNTRVTVQLQAEL